MQLKPADEPNDTIQDTIVRIKQSFQSPLEQITETLSKILQDENTPAEDLKGSLHSLVKVFKEANTSNFFAPNIGKILDNVSSLDLPCPVYDISQLYLVRLSLIWLSFGILYMI